MSRSQQRKGRSSELQLCRLLNEYGIPTKPGRSRSYGSEPDLTGWTGLHLECKNQQRLNVHEAMKQSIKDAERFGDGLPTVIHKRNYSEWLITMKLEDFVTYTKGIWENHE